MKKITNKGFTLIELLAVITIMGILMLVAIPAVSRTIENSRRDTFADVANEYLNAVRNAVLADEIECYSTSGFVAASALPDGVYYFPICTDKSTDTTVCTEITTNGALSKAQIAQQTGDILESGGKSSFGNAHVFGYVTWKKTTSADGKTTTDYRVLIQDTGKHGFDKEYAGTDVKRSNVLPNVGDNTKTNVKGDESSNDGLGAATGSCKLA